VSPSVTSNTIFCLKGELDPDVYTLVLTTYALTLLGERDMAEEFLKRLLGMANRQQDLLWWEKSGMCDLRFSRSVKITILVFWFVRLCGLLGRYPEDQRQHIRCSFSD
jgi:hypothetical protein